MVARRPAEFVDQRAQRHRAVDTTPGDDHVGARGECLRDGEGAEVGVGGKDALGKRGAGEHVPLPRLAQRRNLPADIVALDHGNLQGDSHFARQAGQGVGAALRIDAAGVADDLDSACRDIGQDALHGDLDEVGRVAQFRITAARRGEDRHGQLGEVVEHQVVDRAAADQLRGRDRTVAPEPRSAADADDPAGRRRHGLVHCTAHSGSRPFTIAARASILPFLWSLRAARRAHAPARAASPPSISAMMR